MTLLTALARLLIFPGLLFAVPEPFALKAAIVVLAVILVAAGIWPNAWQTLLGVQP